MRQREHFQSRTRKGGRDWYYFSVPSWAGPCARARTHTHTQPPFSMSPAGTGVRINSIKPLCREKEWKKKEVTLLHAVKGSLSWYCMFVYHLHLLLSASTGARTAGRISTRKEEGGTNSEAIWVHWRPSDMQETLSAVPIKHVRINSGCLQKGGGGKVFSERPVAFPVLGSCYTHPTIICKHTCEHIFL